MKFSLPGGGVWVFDGIGVGVPGGGFGVCDEGVFVGRVGLVGVGSFAFGSMTEK